MLVSVIILSDTQNTDRAEMKSSEIKSTTGTKMHGCIVHKDWCKQKKKKKKLGK